jgi:hypothetical protein
MDLPREILIKRLQGKGLEHNAIPAFIRNLSNTIAGNPQINLRQINRRLHLLGWNEFELDDYTLQLIIAHLEAGAEQNFFPTFLENV